MGTMVGWKGLLKLGAITSGYLPFTGARIDMIEELIQDEGVHGAGVLDPGGTSGPDAFGSLINVARQKNRYEGSIDTNFHGGAGSFADGCRALLEAAIRGDTRYKGFSEFIISPAGGTGYEYDAGQVAQDKTLVNSLRIAANDPSALVTMSAELMSTGRVEATGFSISSYDNVAETGPIADSDNNPVPGYLTDPQITGFPETVDGRATSWQIEIRNNAFYFNAMDGLVDPTDVLVGRMDVSGSITYYKPDGNWTHIWNANGQASDDVFAFLVTLGSRTIEVPKAIRQNTLFPHPGLNAVGVRTINFVGVAEDSGANGSIRMT